MLDKRPRLAMAILALTMLDACDRVPLQTIPPTPLETPGVISTPTIIKWSDAEAAIMAGKVREVVQLHSLKVTLTLKDGQTLVTIEPIIDEVFRVIERCGKKCSDIVLATE